MATQPTHPSRSFPTADLRSGFLVFLIALPLCLGIAMASGFPPVAGILTAIVGGVIVTFLGSARLTIKGPAAGLIVIALGAVTELGMGDLTLGYERTLAVGVMAAVVQIVFALVRVATVGVAMSPSVVHGMLAAIGVIIVSKQAHTMVGVKPEAKEPLALLAELPHSLVNANIEILVVGVLALGALILWPRLKMSWAKRIPAPIVALAIAVPLGQVFDLDHVHDYHLFAHTYHVGPEFLVSLPGSLLDAVAFPDFSMAFDPISLKYVVMFSLVGTIESTLSVIAVDSLSPRREASSLNKDLFATGVGNLVASLIGGLPMISEIVRSKANIDSGAESRWSNFFHGAFLLTFVALLPGLLGEIPLAALAAMLVYTGFRLASPGEFKHAKELGLDQLALFSTTLIVTLATDLLVGVAAGLALKFVLHAVRARSLRKLFRPKVSAVRNEANIDVKISGAATFITLLSVRKLLVEVPPDVDVVTLDFSDVVLVDHTFLAGVASMSKEWEHASLGFVGLDALAANTAHPHSTHRKIADVGT